MGRAAESPFWKRLAAALRAQGMPTGQGAVGRLCTPKITQPAVFKWKTGTGMPTLDNAIQLAKAAKVHTEWLLTGRGPREIPGLDPMTAELLDLWGRMDTTARAWLLQSAKMARSISFHGDEERRRETERRMARSR